MTRYLGIPRFPICATCPRYPSGRDSQRFAGSGSEVNFIRCLILVRLMESFAIVKIKISGQSDLNLASVLVGPQIYVFIFDTAPAYSGHEGPSFRLMPDRDSG